VAKKLTLVVSVVALSVCLAASASAQDEKPYLLSVGGGFSKMVEDGAPSGSFCLGGGVHYLIPSVDGFALGAEFSWLSFGSEDMSGEVLGTTMDLELSSSAIVVTGQASYFVPTSSKASPFVTGGGGLYNMRAHSEGSMSSELLGKVSVDETDSSSEFGINFGGGVKVDTEGRVGFGADVRFHIVFTEVESTNLLTVMGRLFF